MSYEKITSCLRRPDLLNQDLDKVHFYSYLGRGTNDSDSRPYHLYCWLYAGNLFYDQVRQDNDCDFPDYIETQCINIQKEDWDWPLAKDGWVEVVFIYEIEDVHQTDEYGYTGHKETIRLDCMSLLVNIEWNKIVKVMTCMTPEYKLIRNKDEDDE